jgi:hypothetical protein
LPVRYPTPTLTIGGDLDGLCRFISVPSAKSKPLTKSTLHNPSSLPPPSPSFSNRVTRIAESHHLQSTIAQQDLLFPTVVVPGAAHASFLSGYPPLLVRSRDLRPETSEAEVHATVGLLFSEFVSQIITRAAVHPPALAQAVASSKEFFAAIQEAYDPISKYIFTCVSWFSLRFDLMLPDI